VGAGADGRRSVVIARAAVVAEADDAGGTRLVSLRSVAPLVLRATPHAVYLVGGAAGPLGGDDLRLELDVGAQAHVTIRSAAATVVLPGAGTSRVVVTARVAAGGRLRWLVEPTVVARGCRHRIESEVQLEEGAELVWREETILGRHCEEPGSVVTRTRVDLGGRPLLRHELRSGPDEPAWATRAVAAAARAAGSVVVVHPAWRDRRPGVRLLGPTAVVMPLDGPAAQVMVVAPEARSLRTLLDTGMQALGLGGPTSPKCSVTRS
jgi:urease accessory protein